MNPQEKPARSRRQDDRRTAERTTAEIAPTTRDTLWPKYCRIALNLRRSNQAAEFEADLHAGRQPRITEPALMAAALNLVAGMAAAGVRQWDWRPAPDSADLADSVAWAAGRLAEQRTAQDEAERTRRLDQKIARVLVGSQSVGTGQINPVYLQRSELSLDELKQRLEWTKAKHEAEGREFRRQLLDHRSDSYIPVCDGGISNKQITIMACEITGAVNSAPSTPAGRS